MWGYSNNVIIIVTNIIILESLPAGLVHTGTLQLTILTSFNTSQNIRIMRANKVLNLTFLNANLLLI